jgi:hypothetical protein
METVTERKYKTGDRHPDHEFLAFVRYDETGQAEWTSTFFDPAAAFRLAAHSTQGGLEYRSCDRHSTGSEASLSATSRLESSAKNDRGI